MKSLFARIAFRKAVGLYLGEHEVSISLVAATPLGPIELVSTSEACTPAELAGVIERLLSPILGHKRRVPVAVGLPAARVFFGTRPIHSGGEHTPEAVLRKALCSTNISVDDLTVDMLEGSASKQPVASVAACRKKYMAGVVGCLGQLGVRPFRAEPAPCAAVRVAILQQRTPRRAKNVLRICLGPAEGLAAMVSGGLPLCWRTFPLPAGSEGFAILSAARNLQTQSKHFGVETGLDFAMIHGRSDLHARLGKEGLPSELGTRVLWCEGPELGGATIAYGLALGCLKQNAAAFDLSRSMKPRASLREIFPFGELACQGALMVVMGLMLAARSEKLDVAYAASKSECGRNKLLAAEKPNELERGKKELTQKIETVYKFLDSRMLWTTYTRDLASRLPANTQLSQLQGLCPLESGKKKASTKKSLMLQAQATLTPDGSVPREVGDFLASLPKHPLLKRDFPDIRVTNIRPGQSNNKTTASASFAIMCQPAGGKAGKGGEKAKQETK